MSANTDVRVDQEAVVSYDVPEPAPARILELELDQPIPAITSIDERGRCYSRALCLVRLHSQPLGVIEFTFDERGVSAKECARQVWQSLGERINEHLRYDALPELKELDTGGLPASTIPTCIRERENFLAQAPFVSVIVPTHDRPETLAACLRSLLALHYPHYEIIVVDNAPNTSATATLVGQLTRQASQVRYILEKRPGVSWARNSGMKAAKGDILAFTDDDVVVDPYWLVELVRGFGRAKNVACVTGYNMPLELETPAQFWYEAYGGIFWFDEHRDTDWDFQRHIYDRRKNPAKSHLYPYRAGMFGCGASMCFTATFLRSIGGFDPALGGNGPSRCGQDIAVFFQVITRGYTLVYEPAAVIYHLHRRDYSALRRQIYNYGVGMTAYMTKNLLDSPPLVFDFAAKAVLVFFSNLGNRSNRMRKMPAHYPQELVKMRRKGIRYGPLAYVQSRRMMRKLEQAPAAIEKRV